MVSNPDNKKYICDYVLSDYTIDTVTLRAKQNLKLVFKFVLGFR